MAYTTINKSTDYFNTKLYTGNSGTQTISGIGHQPDLIWGKNRASNRHFLADSVRGKKTTGYYLLCTNNTEGDTSNSASDGITSINSDGFVLGANASNTDGGWSYELNGNARNFVAWNWKAGGAGSANTDGDINSTVSVNQTAGFSIVKYTGTDVAGATVGHGLNAVPKMIILKRLVGSGYDWVVYHKDKTAGLYLNSTGTNNDSSSNNIWFNGTAPTSSVFSIGTDGRIGDATNFIAYCFAEKTGYSKIGSYTGNGNANGPMVYTGFKPAFVMARQTNTTNNWIILDNKRDSFNPQDSSLYPNLSNAEDANGADYFDFYSNGMKVRTTNGGTNTSGETYIYMAFAEAPLVGTNNVPCTAR